MESKRPVRFMDRTTPPHIATLLLLAGGSAMAMNIFLPSLPGMTEYFETEYRLLQLSIAIYLGVNAVLQVFIGPLSDKYGRRPIILWGIALFCLATVGCIFAQDVWVFLFFRMCQATIVVAMVLSRAVVRDMVPPDQTASMIAYITMGMAVVPMIAPVAGGLLDEVFGWQANFWFLLITGLGLLALTYYDLGETAGSSGLTLKQQFAEYPELLASPRFWGYALACAFSSGAFFSYLGGAPFVGSEIFGLTPSELGLYFGAPALGYILGNWISGKFSTRFGMNRMILIGCILVTSGICVSILLFTAGLDSALVFFGPMSLVGIGNGMTIPNATAGMLAVRAHLAGTASGLGGAIMIGGGAALSALAGALLRPETGAWPLLWLMLATSVASIVAIIAVILRERHIRGMDPA